MDFYLKDLTNKLAKLRDCAKNEIEKSIYSHLSNFCIWYLREIINKANINK